ncbi:hypothetical protein PHMEG_00039699 [Phytophthora megakarya]|uniref:Uncharacterized protein n=1 Tax=Phytophthora megakarya TaxID=4795 RepID=A0A225UF51_9STRA|nr:hypothetical protein PHMEG_00039699 [Phytophthora megakarya]
MASPEMKAEGAQETTPAVSKMYLDLENISTGSRPQPNEKVSHKKTKVRKRRGLRAQTIEEVFATLSNARSSGLNPPPERIILTPRSAEACLRCGVNPETLKIRDLDSFYDPDVTTAIQRMRHEAYSLRRHEEMQALRVEKQKLVDAADRGEVDSMPSRLIAVSGSKRAIKSSTQSRSNTDGPSSLSSGGSSSRGKKTSALLQIERQRLEKVRQRQERELGQMLEFEMKMNQLQQEATEKMEREKRQHEAMERSRMRFAQEKLVKRNYDESKHESEKKNAKLRLMNTEHRQKLYFTLNNWKFKHDFEN